MEYRFYPSVLSGEITAPPSKSMLHRLIICASLCKGKSEIKNISLSDDIKATLFAIEAIGAKYEVCGDRLIINGCENIIVSKPTVCGESGSTLRFFLPVCLTKDNKVTFIGSKRLFDRPLDEYEKICSEQNITLIKGETSLFASGCLKSGEYTVSGDISSQYISGLLFALPLLDGDSTIKVTAPFVSKSYVEMTVSSLGLFGIGIERRDDFTFFVKGNQKYTACDTVCEGDYSNSAFFEALRFVGSNVKVNGLREKSKQGDRIYRELFAELANGFTKIDVSDCIDIAPLLFVVAALNNGAVFTNTQRLRYKESDRIESMKTELSKFNINIEAGKNTVTVFKSDIKKPTEKAESHNDHRILMALSVLLIKTGGTIKNIECINKSFPDFFDKLEDLGGCYSE